MRLQKDDIPVKVDAPGAVARQLRDFGVASGTIGAEYFTMAAGTDLAPLLQGLEGDACQSPHWGYVLEGELVTSFSDGVTERCSGGDVFYWPPGHSVRVERDAELILFSPQDDHGPVIEHIRRQVEA
jgi:hypothetical protein